MAASAETRVGETDGAGVTGGVSDNYSVSGGKEDRAVASIANCATDTMQSDIGGGEDRSAADDFSEEETDVLGGMSTLTVVSDDDSAQSDTTDTEATTAEVVSPTEPDVFDRLGYGDSEGSDTHETSSSPSAAASDDDSVSTDEECSSGCDDAASAFLDAVVAVGNGTAELDAPALGAMARALAREVGVILEDDDLTQLADAPRAVRVTVRRVADLALALTLKPPDLQRRGPGKTLLSAPVAGSFRIVTLEIVAALLGCSITEAREAVARCPVRRRESADGDGGGSSGTITSGDDGDQTASTSEPQNHTVLTPVTAAAAMLFQYGTSTPAQCAAARVLCAALTVAEEPAWAPLLLRGWGTRARLEGVIPDDESVSAEDRGSGELALHERLAECLRFAVTQTPGQRPCVVGMAVIVAETLRDVQREAKEVERGLERAAAERGDTGNGEGFGAAAERAGGEPSLPASNDDVGDPSPTPITTQANVDQTTPSKTTETEKPSTSSSPQKQSDDGWSKAKLSEALGNSQAWSEVCAENGALFVFETQTRGPLCGPKPWRGISIEDFQNAEFPPGSPTPGPGPASGGNVVVDESMTQSKSTETVPRRMLGGDLLQVLQRLGGVQLTPAKPET